MCLRVMQPALSCRKFEARFPEAPWPMPTRTGTAHLRLRRLRSSAYPASEKVVRPKRLWSTTRRGTSTLHCLPFTQHAAFFVIRAKSNLDYRRRWWRPIDKTPACAAIKPSYCTDPRPQKTTPMPFASSATSTPKRRSDLSIPHQPLRPPSLDRAALQMPLAGGVVPQVDQAAPADQGVLRHLRERGEDPDLDHHQHLRARRHR